MISFSFLTLRPRIKEVGGVIYISNNFLVRLSMLFFYLRNVEIDSDKRSIFIKERWFWFFNNFNIISFDSISHLDYDYDSTTTSWRSTVWGYRREDCVEKFTVTAVTDTNDKYELCAFRGEGAELPNLALDFCGTQDGESREFVNHLCEILEVPLGRQYDFSEMTITCPVCGRDTASAKAKCLYCGSVLSEA